MGLNKPVLIVVAGPNGSGKTSITNEILRHAWFDGCEHANSEEKKSRKCREECLINGKSLLFETDLPIQDEVDFISKAKQHGYFVRLFFIGTNHPSINTRRIARRVIEGGRDVPIPKIITRYSTSIVNCAQAANIADRTYAYDNSVDGQSPQLIFRAINGKIHKEYHLGRDLHWVDGVKYLLRRFY